jgi:TolB protein
LFYLIRIILFLSVINFGACVVESDLNVPHEKKWGVYLYDPESEEIELITSSDDPFKLLNVSNDGNKMVFSRKVNGNSDQDEEIFMIDIDGSNLTRLTDNDYMDVYPCWSPEDTALVFLSSRDDIFNLNLYKIRPDGSDEWLFYDSGFHDADVHWRNTLITFTSRNGIWIIDSDGSNPTQITEHPEAGEWGTAPYPFGDYDPRINPAGNKIAFSRMVDNQNPHGGYDIYTIDLNSHELKNLTNSGYTLGLANWSSDGRVIVYQVAAIGPDGIYDIYTVNAAGTDNKNITPDYFPENFLCHSPMFFDNNSKILFVGEWYD